MINLAAVYQAASKSARLAWAALLLLTLLPGLASAQSATSGSTATGLAPGASAGSYALSGFESVSPYSGGLNFRLPLLAVGGRGGAAHTVTLPVEHKWRIIHTVDSAGQEHFFPDANWWSGYKPGYGPGVLQGRQAGENVQQCAYVPHDSYYWRTLTRLTFTAPDGTEYDLRDTATGGQATNVPSPGPGCQPLNTNRGKVFVTADGSAATFVSDADIYDAAAVVNGGGDGLIYPSGHLMLRDGTRYRVDGGLVRWMRDRNGNLISFDYDTSGRVTTITDSLGRQATVSYAVPGVPYDQINFNGFGGAARTVRVWHASLGSLLRTDRPGDSPSPKTHRELFPQLFDASPYTTYDPRVVSAVELPDGRRYEFRYNVYGELARVMLPTGGAFEYDYAAGVVGEVGYNHTTGGQAEVFSGVTGGTQVYRRVVTRRVCKDGTTAPEESRTTFSRPESYNAGTVLYQYAGHVTVDQTDAGGQLLARVRHYYHGSAHNSLFKGPLDYASCTEGREYKTEAYGADGATLLRKEEQNWQPGASLAANPGLCANARVADVTATLADTNQVSKQTFTYDRYNNVTDVYEYDFGAGAAGALLRRTHTDYVTTNSVPGGAYDYACDPSTTCGNAAVSPNVIHLRDLPRRQWVSSDSAGANKVSLTDYAYDQSALTDRAGITGMCVTFTGAQCSSAGAAGYAARGNATGVTRYADAAAATGAVTTATAYDVAGNVVSTTDARGNTSHVSYGDSFCNGSSCGGASTPNTYAFASGTTSPVPDTSAAQGYPAGTFGSASALTTSAVYDFYTGLTTSTTDANNQTTSLQYDDVLGRLKAVVRPAGGGRTDYVYGDAAGDLHVRVLTDLDAGRRTEAKQFFDGLGRTYRSLTYENQVPGSPWVTTDAQYDALGRAVKASLPYRSAGGPTPLTEGQWSNAKRTETEYDALGRVLSVRTMPDTATVRAAHRGNLVQVTDQAGKSRRSETDALGRLGAVVEFTRTLANPAVVENPSSSDYVTGYSYDAMGNLRKVEQGGQLRFFMYDSLGRLVRTKNPEQGAFAPDADFPSLTDSTSGTINGQWSSGYVYDPNGNLLKRKDARNVTATYGYDALNRNTAVRYAGESGVATPGVNRYYDGATLGLGKGWKSETIGGSLTSIEQYDAVGRPTRRKQQFWNGGAWGQAFTTQLGYNPAGALTSMTYPSGHTVSYRYDIAGRLADHDG
jgi:YD repeat-containing protein